MAPAEASVGIQAGLGASSADVLSLYQRLLPAEFFDQLRQTEKLRQNDRVYHHAVVMWLMIAQRLQGNGTLETAVLELLRGLPASLWPNPCKRLQVGPEGQKLNLSGNTGSYNKARQALPVTLVEQCFDRAFQQLTGEAGGALAGVGRRAFFLNGTTGRCACRTPQRCGKFIHPGPINTGNPTGR